MRFLKSQLMVFLVKNFILGSALVNLNLGLAVYFWKRLLFWALQRKAIPKNSQNYTKAVSNPVFFLF